jgi:hypothetical protein
VTTREGGRRAPVKRERQRETETERDAMRETERQEGKGETSPVKEGHSSGGAIQCQAREGSLLMALVASDRRAESTSATDSLQRTAIFVPLLLLLLLPPLETWPEGSKIDWSRGWQALL